MTAWSTVHPTTIAMGVVACAAALAILILTVRALRRGLTALGRRARRHDPADLLTYVAACIATAVAAQGMWRFFGDVLQFPPVLRGLLFAFIELAVITSAVRARRAMRENQAAGVDGAAVWVLTGISAVLSAMDTRSVAEALFRLAAPLIAAWLWERGMAVERRRVSGRAGINWRLTPERILVRLGLADASAQSASDLSARRLITRVVLAAKHARSLRDVGAAGFRQRWALARLDRSVERAIARTDLAHSEERQGELLAQLGAVYEGEGVLDLRVQAPWAGHPLLMLGAKGAQVAPAGAQATAGQGPPRAGEVGADSTVSTVSVGVSEVGGPVGVGAGQHVGAVGAVGANGWADERASAVGEHRLGEQDGTAGSGPAHGGVRSAPASGQVRLGRAPGRSEGRSAGRTAERSGGAVRRAPAASGAPIPNEEIWRWFVSERRAGREHTEGQWATRWDLPRSTAGRYRRLCLRQWEGQDGSEPASEVVLPVDRARTEPVPVPG